jgi:hypothetical protein
MPNERNETCPTCNSTLTPVPGATCSVCTTCSPDFFPIHDLLAAGADYVAESSDGTLRPVAVVETVDENGELQRKKIVGAPLAGKGEN